MMELVVAHPHVPYIGLMPGSFTPGKWLKIRGLVSLGAFRFNIRLQCSSEIIMQDNVALQLSVNFQNNCISLNSKQNSKWDEAQSVTDVPINYEERFEFAITCDLSHYKIFLNTEHCYELPQKITYDCISHIVIDGDVSIEQISYESELSSLEASLPPVCFKCEDSPPPYSEIEPKAYPIYALNLGSRNVRVPTIPPYSPATAMPHYSPYYMAQPETYTREAEIEEPLNNAFPNFHLQIPYIGTIPRSFGPGKWINLLGAVPPGALRFTINLQCSADIAMQGDVALQIAVNLLDNNIAVNSMRRGIWDEAQTILGIPIKAEERFEIGITCDFTQYKVSINNEHYCEFSQRIVYDRISHLAIDGDITIQQIVYQTELSAPASSVSPSAFSFKQTPEAPPPSYNEVQSKVPFNYGSCAIPNSGAGMPVYPTGTQFVAAVPGYQPYPIQPGVYPAQTGTLIPLNSASSNFRPVSPSRRKKYTTCACVIFIVIIIVAVGLFNGSSNKRHRHRHDHDSGWDY